MDNKEKMIELCKSMVELNEKSSSVFASINKALWQKKLEYWINV